LFWGVHVNFDWMNKIWWTSASVHLPEVVYWQTRLKGVHNTEVSTLERCLHKEILLFLLANFRSKLRYLIFLLHIRKMVNNSVKRSMERNPFMPFLFSLRPNCGSNTSSNGAYYFEWFSREIYCRPDVKHIFVWKKKHSVYTNTDLHKMANMIRSSYLWFYWHFTFFFFNNNNLSYVDLMSLHNMYTRLKKIIDKNSNYIKQSYKLHHITTEVNQKFFYYYLWPNKQMSNWSSK
jgi:hypothetical protein